MRSKIDPDLLKSHLRLGDFDTTYQTTYTQEHDNKGVLPKDMQKEETMKDLRLHHYSLGYDRVNFE